MKKTGKKQCNRTIQGRGEGWEGKGGREGEAWREESGTNTDHRQRRKAGRFLVYKHRSPKTVEHI